VTIDIGEANNIHPANKKDVGYRLALCALANTYDTKVEYSGPLYSGYKIEGDKIRIFFSHAGRRLVTKDEKPKGFTIAGKDRKFVWTDAQIEGTTVVVSSHLIKDPVAVRYAWDVFPKYNLYNMEGLPASPFRTDDWNGITCKQ
jgi:sialate O-acetylesterase